jgi:predicted metal-dependent enzyme (double-stranded beta helix superfamily)
MKQLIDHIRRVLELGATQGKRSPVEGAEIHEMQEVVMEALPNMIDRLAGREYEPGRYLLYKDPDFGFVVMMLVWNHGQATPIHAHGTWGIEAVVKNKVRVTSYACDNQEAREVGSVVLPTGAVAYVLPPDADIHKVEHFGEGQAITVHIYGRELVENMVFIPGVGFKAKPTTVNQLPEDLDWFADVPWPSATLPQA